MKSYQHNYFCKDVGLENSYLEPRVLLRKHVIEALNNQCVFTDEELYFIASFFPDIMRHTMNPNESVVKAYLKSGNTLSADTFPASVWDNDELVFIAASNIPYRYLPPVVVKKITLESIKDFVSTHNNEELAAFQSNYKTTDKKICKYLNSKKIQERIEPLLLESKSETDDNESENTFSPFHQMEHTIRRNSVSYSSRELTSLTETISAIPNRRLYKIDDYNSIRYPRLFHYVTDLHLTNKIYSLVEQGTYLNDAINIVIEKATKSISSSLCRWDEKLYYYYVPQILLIGGDVSFDFEISKLFYEELLRKVPSSVKIYVTLGNHELWDGDPLGTHHHNYKSIIRKYREFFSQFNRLHFLENELAIVVNDSHFDNEEYIVDEYDVFDPNKQEQIKELISNSHYLIFGGIGFAGMNNDFNALNGIYRNTVTTRKHELTLSKKCEKMYKQCLKLSEGKRMICVTHMPLSDWTKPIYKSNCYYVSGHTHNNQYDKDIHFFGDNQIGYLNGKYSLKQFAFDISIDIFENYSDGIHLISNYDYYEFALGIGIHLTMRSTENTKLYLIKRDGIYMFIAKTKAGLCVLNGGSKKKLKKKDIQYYYDNLGYFADAIRLKFTEYNDALNSVSKQIRSLGGNGKIHGCIVDIDFLNHVYLNPFDGKLTYYCAYDINSRTSYDNLQSLLDNNPSKSLTLSRMNKKVQSSKTNNNQVMLREGIISYGKSIYSPSRVLNKIQKLFDYNILQIWDEDLVNQYKTEIKTIESY